MSQTETLTDEELEALKDCKNEQEWTAICEEIKQARGGHYPSDWYSKVIRSGLVAAMSTLFKIYRSNRYDNSK